MAARIPYQANTPWSSQVAQFAGAVSRAQAIGARLIDVLNSMGHDGAGPFDDLEAELGLAPGDGILLYQTVNEANEALAAINIAAVDQGTG
jgi:hypothetical protein